MVLCFAFGCNNGTVVNKSKPEEDKVSFFCFPTRNNPKLRNKWIKATNRSKFDIDNAKTPRLCQEHFTVNSFNKLPELAKSAKCDLRLVKGATPDPNLFVRPKEFETKPRRRTSLAFQKRQNIEVNHYYHFYIILV